MQRFHRQTMRLPDYDYSQPGAYFVTLVTWNREHLFGEIQNGVMRLSEFGRVAKLEWQRLAVRFPFVCLGEFAVMPDHFHGIIWIGESLMGARQEEECKTDEIDFASPRRLSSPKAGSLGSMIGAYKSTSARLIHGLRKSQGSPVWQRNYYEHVIRNEGELQRISAYIQANPANWLLQIDDFE